MTEAREDPDSAVRAAAFKAVERLSVETGGLIPWEVIERGFEYGGERVRLASKALGIFKPRQMSAALSVKTTKPRAGRPSWYRDQGAGTDTDSGLVSYDLVHKRGHWTNDALGRAFERRAPLVYFRAVESSWYEAIWPVWVEDFGLHAGRVLLAAEDTNLRDVSSAQAVQGGGLSRNRSYSKGARKYRNHQAWFSSRTRSAYGYRCAFSGLPLGKLLVGAHIKADEERGPASVNNGICMSMLHHAAFDAYLIGVDPELRIHVARAVMTASDGPLLSSLQGLEGKTLRVPVDPMAAPDPEYLEWRFLRFEAEKA